MGKKKNGKCVSGDPRKRAAEMKLRRETSNAKGKKSMWRRIGAVNSQEVITEMRNFTGSDRRLFDLFFLAITHISKRYRDEFSYMSIIMDSCDEHGYETTVLYDGDIFADFIQVISDTDNYKDKVWTNIEIKNGNINFSLFKREGRVCISEDWSLVGGDLYRATYGLGEDIQDNPWAREAVKIAANNFA